MGRIQLLPEDVASQVAAGEVVERPASVVKELVENSLDAGATSVEVSIHRGGCALIRVIDDGIGMDRDDALLSLERHATSKLRTGQDLAAISTLGFRGEALPSIASVSRFRLTTRPHDAVSGTEIIVNGGRLDSVKDGGEAPGTQIEVRSLFYNLPARRKFLRAENTEASHVEHILRLQAIGHPGVRFILLKNDRVALQLPAAGHLRDRLGDLAGRALVESLLPVPETVAGGIRLSGFIGRAGVSRSTRADMLVFVNGRPIENAVLGKALREGYHTALMKGQFPVTFLFLEMDPGDVDVNVHPAKKEVRFRNPREVGEAIVAAVRQALEGDRARWSRTMLPPGLARVAKDLEAAEQEQIPDPTRRAAPLPPVASITRPPEAVQPGAEGDAREARDRLPYQPSAGTAGKQSPPARDLELRHPEEDQAVMPLESPSRPAFRGGLDRVGNPAPATPAPAVSDEKLKEFRVLGVLGKLYILMENASGLVLVDQHAAHERILFEQLRRRLETQGVATQKLLLPLTIEVSPRDHDWLTLNLPLIQRMGIGLEPFGVTTYKVDSLPQFVKLRDPQGFLWQVIDDLRAASQTTSKLRLGEEMIAKTVCRHAIKANDDLAEREIHGLLKDLLACELPYCCPHGRPTMIQISYTELEKKFGRIQG